MHPPPQLLYHCIHPLNSFIMHCIHPNNLFFTAFISSTLISLYSSLQLLYHYIPLSTFFLSLTVIHLPSTFSQNSWNITFITVFISPAPLPLYSYLQLFTTVLLSQFKTSFSCLPSLFIFHWVLCSVTPSLGVVFCNPITGCCVL